MLLLCKTYLLLLLGRENTIELAEMWVRMKNFCLHNLCKNQNVNTVKTCLVFLTIDRNAEILSGGFNDRFSGCWMYWLFVNFLLPGKFLNNCARESRYFKYNIPKLKEFVQSKSRTSFRIATHFLTNIEFSHRVPTSIFVEIYLWELTTESEYDFLVVDMRSIETTIC